MHQNSKILGKEHYHVVACFVGTSVHAVTSNFSDLFDAAAPSAEGVTNGAAPKVCQDFVGKNQFVGKTRICHNRRR
jgi:hypothetical protein